MRKLISGGRSLLLKTRYNYIPVSNYEVQRKSNPVIEVTLANSAGKQLDIHFRVRILTCSSLRIQSLRQLKISKDCFWVLAPIRVELSHSLTIIS